MISSWITLLLMLIIPSVRLRFLIHFDSHILQILKTFKNSNAFTKSWNFSSSLEFNESIALHFIDNGFNNEKDSNVKTKMIANIGGSFAGVTAVWKAIIGFFLLLNPIIPQI